MPSIHASFKDCKTHQNAIQYQELNNLSAVIEHVQHGCKPFVLQLQNEMLLVTSKHLLISSVYFPQWKPAENIQVTVSFWRADYDTNQLYQKSTENNFKYKQFFFKVNTDKILQCFTHHETVPFVVFIPWWIVRFLLASSLSSNDCFCKRGPVSAG